MCGNVRLGYADKRVRETPMYGSERHLMMLVHSTVNQHYTEMAVEKNKSKLIKVVEYLIMGLRKKINL